MTVTVQTPEQQYTADGVLVTFSYSFRIDNQNDVKVYINNTLQTISADYTVDSFGPTGGTVTFTIAPASATIVTLIRVSAEDQQTDYTAYDAFPAETHEGALDKLTMLYQEIIHKAQFAKDRIGLAWDALNLRITNLADPQLPEDAVNQRTMETFVANNAPQGPPGATGPQGDDGLFGPAGLIGPPGTATVWYTVTGTPSVLLGVNGDYAINSVNGDFYAKIADVWVLQGSLQGPSIPAGGNDHSLLLNLAADDHLQYHNDARGDARYYEQLFLDFALALKADSVHLHIESDISGLDKYTQTEVDGFINGKADLVHLHDSTDVPTVPIRSIAVSNTVALSDAGRKIDMTAAGTVTVATNASVPFSGPVAILVRQGSIGSVTIAPASGVTLRSFPGVSGSRTMAGDGALALLHYRPDRGINEWDLEGRFL